jgi:hypothetical protein
MRATPRPLIALTLTAVVGLTAACGSAADDEAPTAAPAVADLPEWCSTVRSVDRQLELAASTAHLGFEEQQAALGRAHDLIVDLRASSDLLPAAERGAVEGTLDWAAELSAVMADAGTRAEAEEKAAPLYEAISADAEAATTWIKQECGVGLDD